MKFGSKSRVGVGLLLLLIGMINIATWRNARLGDAVEVATFFVVSGAMIIAGLWFCFRGFWRKTS
jgi:hypothetical protein